MDKVLKELASTYPNDMQFGAEVRKLLYKETSGIPTMEARSFISLQDLEPNEMLLKIRRDNVAFLTTPNKDGSMPKSFIDWYDLPIQVIKEFPRTGWEVIDWRGGQSQTWVIVKHPFGFLLEIRMDNFMNDVLPYVNNKHIEGAWQWAKNQIIK